MGTILEVEDLQKRYKDSSFGLKNVSFSISAGSIVGFIGENGAGKSTTMGSIIGTLHKDSGSIKIWGEEIDPKSEYMKEDIGVVFDTMKLPTHLTVERLETVFQQLYKRWNTDTFYHYIDLFSLPRKKKIGKFSRGMSMKLSITVALSHGAKLLLLDEATAGLDPGGREDMLKVLQGFVEDGERGILLSSHITSDIEKIADSLVFIRAGEIVLQEKKDVLLQHYAILECEPNQDKTIDPEIVVAYRDHEGRIDVLVSDKKRIPAFMKQKQFSIDDLTLLLMRGVLV